MDYFKFLPVEIKLDILTRLPAESVLNCKSVCSNWLSVVRHPSFSKKHFHHHLNHADISGTLGFIASASTYSSEEFQYFECNENHDESTTPVQRIKRVNLTSPFKKSMSFAGSSNGLICLEAESVCICNPITREYVMLPKPNKKTYVAGFGYVSSTGEYKVVGILLEFNKQGRHESEFAEVYIYTLGSGKGWRNLGKFTSQFYVLSEWDGPGIFVNGALYWLEPEFDHILTFHLAEENFRDHLSLPSLPQEDGWYDYGIGVLNEVLYFACGLHIKVDRLKHLWLLKNKIDNHDMELRDECQSLGWSKEFKVDGINLLAITKSGGVLHYDSHYLNIYDSKTSTSKKACEV